MANSEEVAQPVNASERAQLVEKIRSMEKGDSFFVPWKKPDQLPFIRRAGYQAKARLAIVFTEHDEVDEVPGTRVQRIGDLPPVSR